MKFSDILGQEQMKQHMQAAIVSGRVSHAYIISGPKSSGKMMMASAFAQTLLCEEKGKEPCGNCKSCIQAASKNNPDIIYVSHEKPNVYSVDEIRQQVVNDVQIKPYSGKYKVYIIDEADKMNPQAQNAILKTIEEPPAYVIIMLLTASAGSFLQTILSRCLTLEMKPVRNEEIELFLRNKYDIVDYEARVCAAFSQGNVGKAVNLATSTEFNELKDEVLQLVKRISDIDPYEMSEAVKRASVYKITIDDYFDLLTVWYRDVLLYKATSDPNLLIFREDVYSIKNAARECSYHGVEEILAALNKAKVRLAANVNFELVMDLLLGVMKENS